MVSHFMNYASNYKTGITFSRVYMSLMKSGGLGCILTEIDLVKMHLNQLLGPKSIADIFTLFPPLIND
jgi:hypothetical protein